MPIKNLRKPTTSVARFGKIPLVEQGRRCLGTIVKKNFVQVFFGTFLNTACRRYTHRLRQRKLTEKESRLEDPIRPYICIKHCLHVCEFGLPSTGNGEFDACTWLYYG